VGDLSTVHAELKETRVGSMGFWEITRLAVICGLYLVVVGVTSRGFIAAPVLRVIDRQVDRYLDEIEVLAAQNSAGPNVPTIKESLIGTLNRIKPSQPTGWRRVLWAFDSPLTKLYADRRELNAVSRNMVDLRKADELDACAAVLLLQLSKIDKADTDALAERFAQAKNEDGKRILVRHMHELVQAKDEHALAVEFEDQRIALWLAMIGLFRALAIGLAIPDHQITLLFGAIGGFLAPLIRINTGQRASTWGVMVLSPVGGALTAIGGLLIVRLLSDRSINVLGEVFRDNSWEKPSSVLALALALLFGFSGRLFSKLAIAGTSQLAPAREKEKESTTE
jgi:hypothetical protein